MNTREYIESGILELYCLGQLSEPENHDVEQMLAHPAIKAELERIQRDLETRAAQQAVKPPAHLEAKVGSLIANLAKEEKMNPNDLPLINKFSSYAAWLRLVPAQIPASIYQERYCQILTNTPTLMQMLVISTTDFEDEVHTDLHESFLILQGDCECTVEDQVRQMQTGDFMDIPLHTHHDVKIKSPYVVAILQRMAI